VETYATDDAELILVTMGAVGETARSAVEEMRAEGMKVGVVRMRLWRPFPYEEFFKAVRGARVIAVLDRALMPGTQGGPLGVEVRSALYGRPEKPAILDFVGGLGGREISRKTFRQMVNRSLRPESDSLTYTLLDGR
jgi:pyruvate ferredoxin oxidoreductase alpha subunit